VRRAADELGYGRMARPARCVATLGRLWGGGRWCHRREYRFRNRRCGPADGAVKAGITLLLASSEYDQRRKRAVRRLLRTARRPQIGGAAGPSQGSRAVTSNAVARVVETWTMVVRSQMCRLATRSAARQLTEQCYLGLRNSGPCGPHEKQRSGVRPFACGIAPCDRRPRGIWKPSADRAPLSHSRGQTAMRALAVVENRIVPHPPPPPPRDSATTDLRSAPLSESRLDGTSVPLESLAGLHDLDFSAYLSRR